MRRSAVVLALALAIAPRAAAAADDVVAGELRSYVTLQSIGVEWDVTGDDDHDATVTVRYRLQGSPAWRDAQPLVRVATTATCSPAACSSSSPGPATTWS